MGCIYRVLWILKSLVNRFVWNHQYFVKIEKKTHIFGMPPNMLPYIYVHSSLWWWTIAEPEFAFKWILREFEVLYFNVWSERMLHFIKDWWKFFQIHQYYRPTTMALTEIVLNCILLVLIFIIQKIR